MNRSELEAIARAMVAPGRGILAADESTGTIKKRFDAIKVENTEENRRAYREMLLTAKGCRVRQRRDPVRRDAAPEDGCRRPVPRASEKEGMVAGIKVDAGAKALAGFPGETVTEGLDGLRERLTEYDELGARFAKWRAVITIGSGSPPGCIDANAHALARYAALCQEAGIAPIVEPEVLMDGDHTIARCETVTDAALEQVFRQLFGVEFERMLLKPNMVIAGKECPARVRQRSPRLRYDVPAPGADRGAGHRVSVRWTERSRCHRASQCDESRSGLPWPLTFCYGRALQESALKAWAGRSESLGAGQKAFLHRARMNGLAQRGKYAASLEAA